MYEQFWPLLLRQLEQKAPSIRARPNRLSHNYWTFTGPRPAGLFSEWVCSFPAAPRRLRAQVFFGSDEQRRGVDVIEMLTPHLGQLKEAYDRPEELHLETWATAAGAHMQRVSVSRLGEVGRVEEHDEYAEWFADRLVQLQTALHAVDEAVAADAVRPRVLGDPVALDPATDDVPSVEQSDVDVRTTALASVVDALAAEPLFHLSLGSRELFHSNLLGWMAEQFPEVMKGVLHDILEVDNASEASFVLREYKQIDLIVAFPGYRPVVFENKVFSLPDQSQLDRYARGNIPRALPDVAVTRVLLSLSEAGWPEDIYGSAGLEWRAFTYRALAERLGQASVTLGMSDAYSAQTVWHYAHLLELLTELIELVQPGTTDEPIDLPAPYVRELKRIRLHSTAAKMRTRHVAHLMQDDLRAAGLDTVRVTDGFAHGSAILETFVPLGDGDIVGWQFQGRQWRRCALFHSLDGRGPDAKARRAAHAAEVHGGWFRAGNTAEADAAKFNHFDPTFIYQPSRMENPTIAELRERALATTREAVDYAAAQAGGARSGQAIGQPASPNHD